MRTTINVPGLSDLHASVASRQQLGGVAALLRQAFGTQRAGVPLLDELMLLVVDDVVS